MMMLMMMLMVDFALAKENQMQNTEKNNSDYDQEEYGPR